MTQIKGIGSIPGPAKGGMLVLAGLGLGATVMAFKGKALIVMAIGLAVLGLLFPLYKMLKKRADARRGAMLTAGVGENSKTAPLGISDPARRAKLDELRKKFDEGVKIFEQYGKNLYALPWYMVVGEPGSGKTEAIRHCNVGFPPGLQDQLQGAGGTLNMNWWFTNSAIFLDTAGRLMFEEVAPGATSEWQEFLKLLKKVRPNCPINGMLLVIPADSLIKDDANSIERKGGRIAQQLDAIQRTLGVRFPVFIVVTKCDLINGFREFFDDLTDPTLQHQIMGWSNPGELDKPFNPDLVDQHLKAVQERLQRRRLSLMIDPVHTEDPQRGKRIDQVDAMFGFPEAFLKIAPRLTRYLQMVFVAGAWSQKPLFLRGIYFTSSMREGQALDAEIAEAMGMPVESLPEGKLWEKERSAFLRDVFLSKVFLERGLVTSAVNAGRHVAKQKRLLYGVAAGAAVLFGAATWIGYRALEKRVVGPSELVRGAASAYNGYKQEQSFWAGAPGTYKLPIVRRPGGDPAKGFVVWEESPDKTEWTPANQPGGDVADAELAKKVINPAAGETPLDAVLKMNAFAETKIEVPAALYPVAMVFGKLDADQSAEFADKARTMVEDSVLRPAYDAARVRIDQDITTGDWSEETTAGLRELLKLELAQARRAAGSAVGEEFKPDVAALLACAARPLPSEPTFRREKVQNLVLFDGQERLLFSDKPEDPESNPRLTLTPKGESGPRKPRKEAFDKLIDTMYFADGDRWPPASLRVSSNWPAGAGTGLLERAANEFNAYWSPSRGGGARELLGLSKLTAALKAYNAAEAKLVEQDFKPTFADDKHATEVAKWEELCRGLGESRKAVDELIFVLPAKTPLRTAYNGAKVKFTAGRGAAQAALVRTLDGLDTLEKKDGLVEGLERVAAILKAPVSETEGFEKDSDLEALDGALIGEGEKRAYAARWESFYEPATALINDSKQKPIEGGAGGVLSAFADVVSQRAADADRALANFAPGTPEKPSRMALASRVSKQAMLLARRGFAGRVVEAEFDAGRPTLDTLKSAAAAKCDGETVTAPELMLLVRPDAGPSPFCPKGAGAVLAGFAAIERDLLAKDTALSGAGAGVPVVLGAEDFARRFKAEIEPGATAFVKAYQDFWSREYARKAEDVREWSAFAQRVQSGNPSASIDGVKTSLESARAAIASTAPGAGAGGGGAGAVASAIAGAEASLRALAQATPDGANDPRSRQWQTVLGNWRGLAGVSDAVKAREQAVKGITEKAEDWLFELPASMAGDGLRDPVSEYRRSVVIAGITALANDSILGMKNQVLGARGRVCFPVRSTSACAEHATEAEVDDLRKALAGIGSGGGSARPPKLNDAEYDRPVGELFGGASLDGEAKEWAEKLGEVLRGLPKLGVPYNCKIEVLPGNEGARGFFARLRVYQGEPGPFKAGNINVGEKHEFIVQYPSSKPVVIELASNEAAAAGRADVTFRTSSPWGALQLLHADGRDATIEPGSREGDNASKVYLVGVPFQVGQETKKLNLRISFEQALPHPKDWPAN